MRIGDHRPRNSGGRRYSCRINETGWVRSRRRFAGGNLCPQTDRHPRVKAISTLLNSSRAGRLAFWSPRHPNISAPFMCLGHIAPATPLVDLIYCSFELITYIKCTMRENDALNREACGWARHQARFPLDRRPLKRRPMAMIAMGKDFR